MCFKTYLLPIFESLDRSIKGAEEIGGKDLIRQLLLEGREQPIIRPIELRVELLALVFDFIVAGVDMFALCFGKW